MQSTTAFACISSCTVSLCPRAEARYSGVHCSYKTDSTIMK